MASSEVKITGLKELDSLLKTLPGNIQNNVMRGAMRSGLNEVGDIAKNILAADGHVVTGNLRKSIRVSFKRKSEKYGWMRGHLLAGDKKAWYSHIIEFGSGSYYVGKGSKSKKAPYEIRPRNHKSLFFAGLMKEIIVHPGVKPSPFMRPAMDSGANRAIQAFAAYVAKRLPKEIKKAQK